MFHATTYKHQQSPFETSILLREPTAVVTEIQAGYNHSSSSFRPTSKVKKSSHSLTNDVKSKKDPMKIQNIMGRDKWTFLQTPKKIEANAPKKLLSLAQLQSKQVQQHASLTKEIEEDIFQQSIFREPAKEVRFDRDDDDFDDVRSNHSSPERVQLPQISSRGSTPRVEERKQKNERFEMLHQDPFAEVPIPSYRSLHPLSNMKESSDFPLELKETKYVEDEQYAFYRRRISDIVDSSKKTQSQDPKSTYGVWYIPIEDWGKKRGSNVENNTSDEMKQAAQKRQKVLQKLQSAKMFKGYLMANKQQIPSFLANVKIKEQPTNTGDGSTPRSLRFT